MENDEIMVSICCNAYNHEKYIRQCLDGFMMQKCNFKFEVLIHDDASTDQTADIIREYEENYPDIIKPIYQTENQHSKGVHITPTLQFPRAKGKYIAMCEGDDYWIDPYVLQKKYDALESNPSCYICLSKVRSISGNDVTLEETFPPDSVNVDCGVIPSDKMIPILLSNTYLFQTSSYFFKSVDLIDSDSQPNFVTEISLDWSYLLFCCYSGDVYYIDEELSHYRRFSIGSWTSAHKSVDSTVKHNTRMKELYEMFDEYSRYKYHDLCKMNIDRRDFRNYELTESYKNMTRKKYRLFLKKYDLESRIYIYANAYFPRTVRMLSKIRRSNKK